MTTQVDLKKVARERSMLDIDTMLGEAVELAALGRFDRAVSILKQLLANLEDRYRGDISKIPVDVLIRRYRILAQLARSYGQGGHYRPAIGNALEAYSLTQGALSDFPELFLETSVELGRWYIAGGDANEAKGIITAAAKAPKGEDQRYAHALVSLGTGMLFQALGKTDHAVQTLAKGIEVLPDPDEPEKALLKADIFISLAAIEKSNPRSSENACLNASLLLFDHGSKAFEKNDLLNAILFFSKSIPLYQDLPCTGEIGERRINALVALARIMDLRGRWAEALRLYKEASDIFVSTGLDYPRGLTLVRAGIGNYYLQMKQYAHAEEELNRAVKCAAACHDSFGICHCYYYLGLVFSKRGSDDKGIELFEESLDMLKELPGSRETRHLEAQIDNQLGFVAGKRRRYEAAIEYFQRSIDILKSSQYDTALGEALRLLGEVHNECGQNMQCERMLKKALEIFDKTGATYEAARTYMSLGANFLSTGDLDKATYFLDESIKILEKLEIESELPMAYSNKAKICIMKEEYREAEELFTKDFNIAKKSENKHSLAFSYYHLGRIRRLLNRTHSAEDFLRRSLELFEQVKNGNMAAHTMIELALCASARLDVKTATDLCAKAQTIFESGRVGPEMAKVLLVRAIVLRDAKRREMARRCFEDSLHALEKLNMVNLDLAETHYEFALFWRDQGDRKEATKHLVTAIELSEKLGLGKKLNNYIAILNEINPEAGAKIRLSRFMDKATVEQISKGNTGEGLKVERKNLSLFFTDIRSFTTISETLGLDELTSFLNDFYTNVTQVIIKFGGLINKFIGDEVMAVFNMDGTMENHAEMAVRAGIDLQRTMNEITLIRERRGEMGIGIGVGINTGEVLLGSFGSSVRQEYTAIGDNVNIAARLQSQAKAGEIVVSQAVYDLVRDIVIAEDMGEKPLKGKGQPLRLWKIRELKEQ
jgi:class 3 adenylate cyclase/Tfp pilus assembly protein PilF